METLFAKAERCTHVMLGVVLVGERHGNVAMQQAATVFNDLWEKEDNESCPPFDVRSPPAKVDISP